jgi:hypothetical protein
MLIRRKRLTHSNSSNGFAVVAEAVPPAQTTSGGGFSGSEPIQRHQRAFTDFMVAGDDARFLRFGQ